jgi:hypothetical protein
LNEFEGVDGKRQKKQCKLVQWLIFKEENDMDFAGNHGRQLHKETVAKMNIQSDQRTFLTTAPCFAPFDGFCSFYWRTNTWRYLWEQAFARQPRAIQSQIVDSVDHICVPDKPSESDTCIGA